MEKFAETLCRHFKKYEVITDEEVEEYAYYCCVFLEKIVGMILLLSAACIFRKFWQTVVFWTFFLN
mgnify:CR=1 FL=1